MARDFFHKHILLSYTIWFTSIKMQLHSSVLCTFYGFCIYMIKMRSFKITWHILLLYNISCTWLYSMDPNTICRGCLPLLIGVYRLIDFGQMWFESKYNRNYKEKKRNIGQNWHFHIWGPNLKRAETSWPKPLGVKSEKGRNLWQPNLGVDRV